MIFGCEGSVRIVMLAHIVNPMSSCPEPLEGVLLTYIHFASRHLGLLLASDGDSSTLATCVFIALGLLMIIVAGKLIEQAIPWQTPSADAHLHAAIISLPVRVSFADVAYGVASFGLAFPTGWLLFSAGTIHALMENNEIRVHVMVCRFIIGAFLTVGLGLLIFMAGPRIQHPPNERQQRQNYVDAASSYESQNSTPGVPSRNGG